MNIAPNRRILLVDDLPAIHEDFRKILMPVAAQADGLADMTHIAELFNRDGIAVDDLGLQRPSLDDVFLALTGHRAEDEEAPLESELEGAVR